MKVNTLYLRCVVIAVYENEKTENFTSSILCGCAPMVDYLEKSFGIKTVPSTVFAAKKVWIPTLFPYGFSEDYYLAYLNWVFNRVQKNRSEFFDTDPNMLSYFENNPIIKIQVTIRKN